jgi:hypothetical protein
MEKIQGNKLGCLRIREVKKGERGGVNPKLIRKIRKFLKKLLILAWI